MFKKNQLISVLIALLSTAGVQAQVTIEEVVVTAQKREQSMQDVGIAINAFSGEMIDAMGMTSSNEVAAITPNLSITNPVGEGGTHAVVIRGVGLSDFSVTNQPPVGFNVDEVPAGNANAQISTLFDVERIEVLKGPQGTLYGKNTTGGAINIISRKPTEELNGYAKLSLAEYGIHKFEAAVGGELTDGLQGRVALVDYHADGWQKNTTQDSDVEKNNFAMRTLLAWQPSDDVDVLLNLHGARNKSDADLYAADTDPKFYKNGSEYKPRLNIDSLGGSLKIEWDLSDNLTLTSLTAYDDGDKLHEEDGDMMPVDLLQTRYEAQTHTFSQELRLNGLNENGDNWIAGVFYGRDVINGDTYLNLFSKAVEWAYDLHQEVETAALFGQYEYNLSDTLRLTLGLRATHDKVEFEDRAGVHDGGIDLAGDGSLIGYDSIQNGVYDYFALLDGVVGPDNPNVDASGLYKDDISNTEFSGKIGLDWEVSEDLMLYASISRGYKTGAFPGNFIFNPVALEPYDKELLTAYEVGMKGDFFEGLLRLNAAAFYYDYKDAQIYNTNDDLIVGLPANRVVNLDVDVWGIDADLTWLPMDGLFVSLAAGITKSEYKEDIDDDITGDVPVKGNQLQNAPEASAALVVNYEWMLRDSTLNLQFDATWQDETFFTTNEDANVAQDSYALMNARLAWRSPDESWELALWGKNLADKEYTTYVYDLQTLFGFNQLMRGTPSTYGVDVKFNF